MTHRRTFIPIPTWLLAVFLWLLVGYMIYFLSPTPTVVAFFLLSLFFALVFTNWPLLGARRCILLALGLTGFLALKAIQMAYLHNLLLLLAIIFTLEILFTRS